MLSGIRGDSVMARLLRNSGWLIGEQLIRLGTGFLISLWLARQLGPAGFGSFNYAIAFTSIFAIFTTLGMSRIMVRELVAHHADPVYCSRLLSTSIAMRLPAAGVAWLACAASGWAAGGTEALLIAWVAAGFFFSATSDSLVQYFQAREAIRHATLARLLSLLAVTGLRIALLLLEADVLYFALALLLEQMAGALAMLVTYRRFGIGLSPRHVDWTLAHSLLRESWPEIIAGFSGMLFMRLDQVMLQHMAGPEAVGAYAVATRLSELWYFIPAAIVSATYPRIIHLRESNRRSYQSSLLALMAVLAGLSYLTVAATHLLATPVIPLLFGEAYRAAAPILLIHIWCGLFIGLGLASGSWIMAERRAVLNLYRNLAGAGLNILLNLALIPVYGAIGAAYATLAAMALAYLAFDFLVPGMREVRMLKLKALLLLPYSSRLLFRSPPGQDQRP